ncbi:MAG: hypothetical protein QOH70_3047 [Blastocatellia bacterium]|nr:hypothetical protein [Blastocatellia bacterium]
MVLRTRLVSPRSGLTEARRAEMNSCRFFGPLNLSVKKAASHPCTLKACNSIALGNAHGKLNPRNRFATERVEFSMREVRPFQGPIFF